MIKFQTSTEIFSSRNLEFLILTFLMNNCVILNLRNGKITSRFLKFLNFPNEFWISHAKVHVILPSMKIQMQIAMLIMDYSLQNLVVEFLSKVK